MRQVFDGYIVKYFASVVALLVYAAPLYFRDPALRASQADLTQVSHIPWGLISLCAGLCQACGNLDSVHGNALRQHG